MPSCGEEKMDSLQGSNRDFGTCLSTVFTIFTTVTPYACATSLSRFLDLVRWPGWKSIRYPSGNLLLLILELYGDALLSLVSPLSRLIHVVPFLSPPILMRALIACSYYLLLLFALVISFPS